MGVFSTKTKYLIKEEIDKIAATNPTLEKVFERYRNYDGYIAYRDFDQLLGNKVDDSIKRKIFKLFASERNKLTFENLKNLYSIFYSIHYEGKVAFLSDLIFSDKTSKPLSKYVRRITLMLNHADDLKHNLLQSEFYQKFWDKNSNLVVKEGFVNSLTKNYQKYMSKFSFSEYQDKDKVYLKIGCKCYLKKKQINKSNSSVPAIGQSSETMFQYDQMEDEFRRKEKLNDGIFTIQLFEKMLNDIDLDTKLTNHITTYLKRKTEKVKIISHIRII